MKKVTDFLTENKRFKTIPIIDFNGITWNTNKSESKLLKQLNERVTLGHIKDSEVLGNIITKAIKKAYSDCQIGHGEENDTCIKCMLSSFIIIFNKSGNFIRSIRKTNDNLSCSKIKVIYEKDEIKAFFDYMDIEVFDEDAIYEGLKITCINESFDLQIETVCKCLELNI